MRHSSEMVFEHEHGRNKVRGQADFVWAPYEAILPKNRIRAHACIAHGSLVEYIGVEWCTRISDQEKIPYIQQIFKHLAYAGNDSATLSAFLLLEEIYSSTELYRRCKDLYASTQRKKITRLNFSWCKDVAHPYYPSQKLVDVVQRELHHELLEFISFYLWISPDFRLRSANPHSALLETRKKMLATCGEKWNGIPRNTNDELTFAILCKAAVGHANHQSSAKELNDALQQVLRDALNRIHAKNETEIGWKYWMTRPEHPEHVEIVLNVFAKTRTAIGGYQNALADIEARAQITRLNT